MPAVHPISDLRRTPLWAILAFTFLNSIGSAVVYSGIFFLAKSQYSFTQTQNFALGLLYGLTYIPGAIAIGPVLRRIAGVGAAPRHVLAFIMLSMTLLCWLPWAAARSGVSGAWPIWLTVGLYSPLSGALWPIVESFLAGGRSEHELRSATGKFNVTWSSSLVVTLLAMSPLVESHALLVLQGLGVVHLSCTLVLLAFAPVPAEHTHESRPARPVVYKQLLSFLRLMLPVAFMFISTLSPYLPSALQRAGIEAGWATAATATWLFARVVTFFAMERSHAWHGRWSTPVFGGLVLAVSFAWFVLLPPLAGGAPGLILMLVGLAGFGVGVGVIYAAALYYAMEVGDSGVDAGGMHETLIGIGYCAGPLCGLLAAGAGSAGIVAPKSQSLLMLVLVLAVALIVGLIAAAYSRRVGRRTVPAGTPTETAASRVSVD